MQDFTVTETSFIAEVRRLIREPSSMQITDADITGKYLYKATVELQRLLDKNASESVTSYCVLQADNDANVFSFRQTSFPISRITNVWDLGTNAVTVTACADNGSSLPRLTAATHGFSTGDFLRIQGVMYPPPVVLNTEITVITADTFDCKDVAYDSTIVSGGLAWKDYDDTVDVVLLKRTNEQNVDWTDDSQYIIRHDFYPYDASDLPPSNYKIIVTDDDFEHDILVAYTVDLISALKLYKDYVTPVDSLAWIPPRLFDILCARTAIDIITPMPFDTGTTDGMALLRSFKYCQAVWEGAASAVSTEKIASFPLRQGTRPFL